MTLVFLAALLGGCGEERSDNAVEAREGNTVRMEGLTYRAVLFRELNTHVAPDRSLVDGVRPGRDAGFYAAFVRVCNEAEDARRPTGDIVLEDAFGEVFRPLRSGVDPAVAYQPRELGPGECIPVPDSTASDSFSGAAIVFEVPFDAAQRRPLVLELRPRDGGEPARIQLDL